jgi:hypothetical protein
VQEGLMLEEVLVVQEELAVQEVLDVQERIVVVRRVLLPKVSLWLSLLRYMVSHVLNGVSSAVVIEIM